MIFEGEAYAEEAAGATDAEQAAAGDEASSAQGGAGDEASSAQGGAGGAGALAGGASVGGTGEEAQNSSSLNLDEEANSVKEDQLPDSSFIYDTSIASLARADSYYNKMTVQVVGEAVGDVIEDTNWGSENCWVSLWDANETVSVFMSDKNAQLIDTLGSHHRSGTKLQVRGEFHISCEDHDGISDLHAETVSVQSRGFDVQEDFSPVAFLPGVLLLVVGFALFFLFRYLRERNM